MDLEESLYRIMKGARDHAPGKPYDASEHPLDVGELLWRGLICPVALECVADIIVDVGHPLKPGLCFTVTPIGKNWMICRSAEKGGGT